MGRVGLSEAERQEKRRIRSLKELFQYIREDKRVNDNSIFRPGFQAMVVYRFGVWREGITPKILRLPFTLLYRIAHIFVRNFYGIELPFSTRIGRRLRVAHQHSIIVHPDTVIGDDCMIRQGVSIGIARVAKSKPGKSLAPVLGDRVEVGANATIIGPVKIGNDVAIGPNVCVINNVPDNSMVIGPMPRTIPRPKGVTGSERKT
ncbi:serine O-acetyltransferase [Ruegeria atlantica]|nr:serine acetyltransferase [Ruegeria atlantica]